VIRVKYRYDPSGRSIQQPLGGQGQGQSPFPGISDPFFGGSNNQMVPFDPAQFQNPQPIPVPPAAEMIADNAAATPAKAGGFSLPSSLSDLKGFVDRMGGIDGIVSTMTKMQKVVGSITQMAPLIKVLAGSFGKKGAAASIADEDGDGLAPPRRRKRRGTGKSGSSAGRKRRPVKKRRR